VFSSPNLVHWADRGFAFHKTPTSWGRDHFWAPCVVEHNGAFYLIYSCIGQVAPGKMSHRICIAKADAPTGPFTDIKAPLLDIGTATIDAHVMIDPDDGKPYLYYVRDRSECPQSEIYVVRLSDDLTQTIGEPAFCTKPDAAWEGDKWNEGPFVFNWRDKYIKMYSARGFFDPNYALGLATADSPMGPFKKSPDNPILHKTDKTSGPGHNSVIASPDGKELFCAYHIHRKLEGGQERDLAIDRMTITKDPAGEVHVKITGPSRDAQPMPSGAAELSAGVK
jgi:beta-xylosidase